MVDTSELESYLVGGAVRDEQLGREPNDEDFLVVGSTEEEMLELGFEQPVGEAFAVFIHPETGDEWALARTEVSEDDTPWGFDVRADPSVSLEEDLERRDLTINAMAKDVETGELFDPHGGMNDLENQLLRHVSPAFAEDPLRVIRVATFMARLPEFEVHPETAEFCRELVPALAEHVDPTRVGQELEKAMRKAESPRRFFDALRDFGALEVVSPVLDELTEVPAGPEKYHKEGSAFEHTMRVLEEAHSRMPDNPRILWAALAHDMGKAFTSEDDLPSHPKHTSHLGHDAVNQFVDHLDLPNVKRRLMHDAVSFHMNFHWIDDLQAGTLLEMVEKFNEPKRLTSEEFVTLGVADSLGREPAKVEMDVDRVKAHIEAGQTAIGGFNGGDAFENFDLVPEDRDKIGKVIHQERTKIVKEHRPV